MTKDLLQCICNGIIHHNSEIIGEADSNPDKWYELMVVYDNGSTQTVESGDTFAECFSHVEKYFAGYRFDRLNIDVWNNRDNPENGQGFLSPSLIYQLISKYLTESGEIKNLEMYGYFEFDEEGKQCRFQSDYTREGQVFKDEILFTYFFDKICYISESEFEGAEGEKIEGSTYTDFVSICEGNVRNVLLLFDQTQWEHPSTVYDQWEINGILDDEDDENDPKEGHGKPPVLVYTDSGDFVSCTWCSRKMIVPTGADKCPHCYCEGSLSWGEDERQEVNYSDLENEGKYYLINKNEPEREEYLTDETLIEEFNVIPSGKYINTETSNYHNGTKILFGTKAEKLLKYLLGGDGATFVYQIVRDNPDYSHCGIFREGNKFIVFDNTSCECNVEEFEFEEDALKWLKGDYEGTEDFKGKTSAC
jgi:hypothetical protein